MPINETRAPRSVVVVLFDRFELLDVFGPLELFGALPDRFEILLLGEKAGPVRSAQGPIVLADHSYEDAPRPDVVLVPGGIGTRTLVQDRSFSAWLTAWALQAELVTSICTGSGVLAAASLLDGYRATSTKRAFHWARAQGPRVDWIAQARWVEDRDRWTSAGVAAGVDMTLALIAHQHIPWMHPKRPHSKLSSTRAVSEDGVSAPVVAGNGIATWHVPSDLLCQQGSDGVRVLTDVESALGSVELVQGPHCPSSIHAAHPGANL